MPPRGRGRSQETHGGTLETSLWYHQQPLSFRSKGVGHQRQARTNLGELLHGTAWVPHPWESCTTTQWGSWNSHCQELRSSGQHGLCRYSTRPDPTSSQLSRIKVLSQNLAKIRQDQGHVFKQRPGDQTDTPFKLNGPLLLPTGLLLKAMPITSAGGYMH